MQVYVPLNDADVTYAHTKPFAKAVAELLEQAEPELVVSRMTKALRKGKVLVDWSQNDEHKTTVNVYSLRARERPTVSTPLTWDEVARVRTRPATRTLLVFDAEQVLARVERDGDLFADAAEPRPGASEAVRPSDELLDRLVAEATVRTARSSGPGGQHANVTASRVEVALDLDSSQVLGEEDRRRLRARYGPRVTAVAQETRSQARNRELALDRLRERLRSGLTVRRTRHATRPTAASRHRKADAKRRQAQRKQGRRRPSGDD